MDFFSVVDTQRALRRFLPDPVPDDVLHQILAAATRAPSARGAEPWPFCVVRDPACRSVIGEHYRRAWESGLAASVAGDADRDLKGRTHYARMMRAAGDLAHHLSEAPVLVVCCLDHRQLGP